jgi:aarF domain-containing kinase
VLDSMNYLRGATTKVGQTLGSFPDIVPDEFVETLEQLHFSASPMHYSLLREMVFNELGDEPENLFRSFEKRAFAAASIGQVHRAQLKSGGQVAVKIQYPGIGRTIAADFRNLFLFLLPARLGSDWASTREQFEDLRVRLERETDYKQEAATLQKVAALFRDADGIVIPRVYPEFSTERVLTMQRIDGVHLGEFLAGDPPQDRRNAFAEKILRAWYRMHYAGGLVYADFHPGNFIFMEDGRLGVIDFGCMIESDWKRGMVERAATGSREDRIRGVKEWSCIGDDPADADRLRVVEQYTDWLWRPRNCGGVFDFGDEAEFRRGIDLFVEILRKRYSGGRASTPMAARQQLTLRAFLYRLRAKVDVAPIAEEEVRASGLERGDEASA